MPPRHLQAHFSREFVCLPQITNKLWTAVPVVYDTQDKNRNRYFHIKSFTGLKTVAVSHRSGRHLYIHCCPASHNVRFLVFGRLFEPPAYFDEISSQNGKKGNYSSAIDYSMPTQAISGFHGGLKTQNSIF